MKVNEKGEFIMLRTNEQLKLMKREYSQRKRYSLVPRKEEVEGVYDDILELIEEVMRLRAVVEG